MCDDLDIITVARLAAPLARACTALGDPSMQEQRTWHK